jgi:signal transduction histidine kinase
MDREGRLWFANGSVLQMFDPRLAVASPIVPTVHVEGLTVDRRVYAVRDGVQLPPRVRDLQIDYTAPSFIASRKIRFQYFLEGRDSEWQEAGMRRQAFYTDLRPGTYRFRVRASNSDGVWNVDGAEFTFVVAPAWYQTWIFGSTSVAAGLLGVWVLYRWRVRQIAANIRAQFDERLAERTRLARDLHDTFLQTIQGSKLVADHALKQPDDLDRLRSAMEQLSRWLAQAVIEGRAALRSLRTSTAETDDLVDALRRAADTDCQRASMVATVAAVGFPRAVHAIVRDDVYRIAFEAIRNACTHSGGSRLALEVRFERNLTVTVCDDGKGAELAVIEEGRDGHFGLQGMRERATRIGGSLTMRSTAAGTEVTLVVPGEIAFGSTERTA